MFIKFPVGRSSDHHLNSFESHVFILGILSGLKIKVNIKTKTHLEERTSAL